MLFAANLDNVGGVSTTRTLGMEGVNGTALQRGHCGFNET